MSKVGHLFSLYTFIRIIYIVYIIIHAFYEVHTLRYPYILSLVKSFFYEKLIVIHFTNRK